MRNRRNTEPREQSTLISRNPRHVIQITKTTTSSGETGNHASPSYVEILQQQQHISILGNNSRPVPSAPAQNHPSYSLEKLPPSYEDAYRYYATE